MVPSKHPRILAGMPKRASSQKYGIMGNRSVLTKTKAQLSIKNNQAYKNKIKNKEFMAKIKRRKQTIENDPQEIQILELSDRL